MAKDTNPDGRREEITIEVDEWTARRLEDLAWSHEQTAGEIARQCCRYGVLDYESALDVDAKTS